MEDLPAFLNRAAAKCGFSRDHYVDRNLPTNPDDIAVVHFFGDLRSEFVLSSLLLKRFRDELRGSKYMILCTWGGHRGLFPYVDEHWSPSDRQATDCLRREAIGFGNTSAIYQEQRRELNYFFRHLITPDDMSRLYDGGFTQEFWGRLGTIRRFLPSVPSASYLSPAFNQGVINRPGYKVLLMPLRQGRGFAAGRMINVRACREFWHALISRLVQEGYCPIVVQSHMTHDLSGDFSDKAIFVEEEEMDRVLGMMRATGLILDVFGGVSRLALAARTPFVAIDERGRFAAEREYEIDDICGADIPRRYIFSFSTILEGGDRVGWDGSLFDNVIAKLGVLLSVDRGSLPGTSEGVAEVPIGVLRERRARRLGTRFVKIPGDQ